MIPSVRALLAATCLATASMTCGAAAPAADATREAAADTSGAEWASKLRRSEIKSGSGGALFESRSWTPPPAPPRAAKTDPTPPPFPYVYMGKAEVAGQRPTVYLTKGAQIYTASSGSTLEGVYRVDEIAADRIELTYLPLGKKQTIAFASITPRAQVGAAARFPAPGGDAADPASPSAMPMSPPGSPAAAQPAPAGVARSEGRRPRTATREPIATRAIVGATESGREASPIPSPAVLPKSSAPSPHGK